MRDVEPLQLAFVFFVVLLPALACAMASDYTITILKSDPLALLSRPEQHASAELVGKSIVAIFGPLTEVRVEWGGVNTTVTDGNTKTLEQKIRERIDRAKCLGRDSEVAWHKAPWVRGHILLQDGRILPIQILLSGILVGNLLFAEEVSSNSPANATSPRR